MAHMRRANAQACERSNPPLGSHAPSRTPNEVVVEPAKTASRHAGTRRVTRRTLCGKWRSNCVQCTAVDVMQHAVMDIRRALRGALLVERTNGGHSCGGRSESPRIALPRESVVGNRTFRYAISNGFTGFANLAGTISLETFSRRDRPSGFALTVG